MFFIKNLKFSNSGGLGSTLRVPNNIRVGFRSTWIFFGSCMDRSYLDRIIFGLTWIRPDPIVRSVWGQMNATLFRPLSLQVRSAWWESGWRSNCCYVKKMLMLALLILEGTSDHYNEERTTHRLGNWAEPNRGLLRAWLE